ncbi:MAG: FAD-binding oxidoreductase [Thermoanaerobaculia bacterium]
MARSLAAKITAKEDLAPHVVQVTVAFEEGKLDFAPGQYCTFVFSDHTVRAYSVASAPQRPSAIQLCVRVGSGRGSQAIDHLDVGETLRVEGPFGNFSVPAGDGPVTFIAGDTGIAPVRSMILDLVATRNPRPVKVLFEPYDSVLLYERDLAPLARAGRIGYETGSVDDLVGRNRDAIAKSVVRVSGYEPFLVKVKGIFAAAGLEPEAQFESFGHLPEPAG